MSDKEFVTFDGKTSFAANLTCSSEAPVIKVTAFPVGNLSGIGELNLQIDYDKDLDGKMEERITVQNVAGICGNGLIKDCKPSGSWRQCSYCKWEMVNGKIEEKCDYGTGDKVAPIGPQGLRGCFCFNASCGSPVMSMMETILSFAANGVLNVLREENNLLVVTQPDYSPGSMELSFLGARVTNCSETGNDAAVAELTALQGKFDFPYSDALAKAEADPSHPYNAIVSNFGSDGSTFSKCIMEAKVGIETRKVTRAIPLNFGVGVDAEGGSKQCYWFRSGYCGTVFGETRYLNVCIGRIIPAALGDLCNQFLVNSGSLDEITGISDYRATSGVANYIGCYGSENDSADQLWTVICHGPKTQDLFVCKSPSMSVPGETISNSNPALFQGCDEIQPPLDSCEQLEKKRQNGECQLHSELVDGVYSYREGSMTGLEPARTCRNIAGGGRSITVCEPWWKKERVYRCKGEEADFSQAKERTKYIGAHTSYNTIHFPQPVQNHVSSRSSKRRVFPKCRNRARPAHFLLYKIALPASG